MRKIVSLFLALCLVLGMASVAAADDEFVLNLCIASEPETIDPNLGSSVDSAIYANHQFENLMKYAPTAEHPANDPTVYNVDVVPGQAASKSSFFT